MEAEKHSAGPPVHLPCSSNLLGLLGIPNGDKVMRSWRALVSPGYLTSSCLKYISAGFSSPCEGLWKLKLLYVKFFVCFNKESKESLYSILAKL